MAKTAILIPIFIHSGISSIGRGSLHLRQSIYKRSRLDRSQQFSICQSIDHSHLLF